MKLTEEMLQDATAHIVFSPEVEMIENAVRDIMIEVELVKDELLDAEDIEPTLRKYLTAMYLNGITFGKTQEVK